MNFPGGTLPPHLSGRTRNQNHCSLVLCLERKLKETGKRPNQQRASARCVRAAAAFSTVVVAIVHCFRGGAATLSRTSLIELEPGEELILLFVAEAIEYPIRPGMKFFLAVNCVFEGPTVF